MIARQQSEEDKDKKKKEVATLLAIFQRFIDAGGDEEAKEEATIALMEKRADIAIQYACDGFGISFEDALELLRNEEGLSPEDIERRNIVVAAADNLVDFSVAEEYQMLAEIEDLIEELEQESEQGDEEKDDNEIELMYLAVFAKYNQRYAGVENMDIEYAMSVAAALMEVRSTSLLIYMTMGDERVRPWHLQYEGFTAPKESFPQWLIPPIEHQCRCYLVEDEVRGQIQAKTTEVEKPEWFNPTFKESVALGGRIFSDEHPYFKVKCQHAKKLGKYAQTIKDKYYGRNQDKA